MGRPLHAAPRRPPPLTTRAAPVGLLGAGAAALVVAGALALTGGGSSASRPTPVDIGIIPTAPPPVAGVGAGGAVGAVAAKRAGGGGSEAGTASGGGPARVTGGPAGPSTPVAPEVISIARLGVRATVEAVAVGRDGALAVPHDPAVVGWWAAGPMPGASAGTAVLDSHVDEGGQPGAFAGLGRLRPGDVVELSGATATDRFVVTGLREYPKSSLPWASVFTTAVEGRLALVTCGGAFDSSTGHYADNIVAFALPAPAA